APPLRLPDGPAGNGRWRPGQRRPRGTRWAGWAAPLAAAAAVAAIIWAVASVAPDHPRTPSHATSHRQVVENPLAAVPPYYLELTSARHTRALVYPQVAQIRATATGALLATMTPPRPFRAFDLASAAGNGHDFVLAASSWRAEYSRGRAVAARTGPPTFYLLHLGPDGRPAGLTRLALPAEPASATISDIALTPDAAQFAVAWRGGRGGGPGPRIQVFALATGAERVWTWPGGGPVTNNAGGIGHVLSWTADGRELAFQQWVGNSIDIRLLDTTTPGGSLRADSRLAVQWRDDAESFHYVHGRASNVILGPSAIITGDGTKIAAATASETLHPLSSEVAFTEFSTATGQPVTALGEWQLPGMYPGQGEDVLWSSPDGRTLIVVAHTPGRPGILPRGTNVANYGLELGVQTAAGFTPLPAQLPRGTSPWPAW
ncbi:MAG TPA: hypothetical protein VIX86_19515, partial [Streptosporangiaceae bacterium]